MDGSCPITTASGLEQHRIRLPSFSLTAVLLLVIGAVFCSPAATAWLEFDRGAIAAGQWWRLVTSNLTHWNGENLFWNAVVFTVLGCLCEARGRARYAVCISASALSIGISVLLFEPHLSTCRGISGVDSALFAFLAMTLLRAHWSERNWRWVAAVGVLLVGFAVKTIVELTSGRAVFVDAAAAGFTPMPLAHALGAAVGALAAIISPRLPAADSGSRAAGQSEAPRPCDPPGP
ncbi:MAG: rhombosortase [Planctomycetota bacterium]|jgi:rhomboid family GlyGly-CTERM serine protease